MFANVTIRPLLKKVVCFWERGSMLLGKSSWPLVGKFQMKNYQSIACVFVCFIISKNELSVKISYLCYGINI